MEGRFIRLVGNPNTLSQKDTRVIETKGHEGNRRGGEEGGFIRLADNPSTMSLKAGSLVELKCNRALVFMSTRARCLSISPGL